MEHLNEKQKQAATHQSGPILVIAGAGTGKTRVITERISHILKSGWAKNHEVLALTFTEKATGEIEERVDTMMPLGYEPVPIKTFHGFAESVLRDFGVDIGLASDYQILHGVRQWAFIREHLFDLELDYYRPLNNPTKFIHALTGFFSKLREELVSEQVFEEFAAGLPEGDDEEKLEKKRLQELARAYKKYGELKIKKNFLDFSDLQYYVIELFKKRPNILRHLQNTYKYVLVDEYQDTNIAQNRIVDMLVKPHQNLMVVGDDDQSIYKFRGAAISNILQFQENYPEAKVVVLTENYRSSQSILDFAYTSIQKNNPDRLEVKSGVNKKLTGQMKGADDSVTVMHGTTIEQEIEYVVEKIQKAEVPLSDIALLFRANNHAQPYIEAFKKAGIPYQFVSERGLYHKEEILDLTAVLRFLANPTDDISFYRILRMPIWNLKMESIARWIPEAKKAYQTIFDHLKDKPEAEFLVKVMKELLEYSKDHTVGEVLYQFTTVTRLYEQLLKEDSLEADEQIVNIAHFFGKIQEFERGTDENSVIDFVAYLDMAEEAGDNPSAAMAIENRDAVFVSSIHGAKGLEFNTVFMPSLVSQRFPSRHRRDPIEVPDELVGEILTEKEAHMEEERRLFYVGVTRAKEKLHLLHADYYAPSLAANPRKKKRSQFIDEIIDEVTVTFVEKTVEGVETFLKPKPKQVMAGETEAAKPDKITSFSYSQLATFETCPRQYEYQYLLKIPQPPSGNMNFGITLHNTLQEFYKRVMQQKQATLFEEFEPDVSLNKLLEIYEEKWIPHGFDSKTHMEARKERGKEILRKFYDSFQNEVSRVKYLEKGFKIKVGDYSIRGRVDRVDDRGDGTVEIIDYKAGKAKPLKTVEKDMQLMIYAIAAQEVFGFPATLLTLYFLDDDEKVSVEPDAEKLEKAKVKIKETADAINESNFEPTPDRFKCGYCPFNKICDAAAL